jgi:glucose-6-phosphate isomerase
MKTAWWDIIGCEIRLAPTTEIRNEIEQTIARIKEFAAKIHSGQIRGAGGSFRNYLLIGIGGSALGPQFVANALGEPRTDKLKPHFFDNTDPDGMNRVLAGIGSDLNTTLCIVISKSGGTKETRNGITVLGNKGATDQHSYVQRLRDGLNDFFATFIEVLYDGNPPNIAVEPNTTSGDFLEGFYLGTRQALADKNIESVTITIKKVSPF